MTDLTLQPVELRSLLAQEATGNVPMSQDDYARLGAKLAQTWPARMVRGAWSGMTAPGDVLSGKLDPNSPEGQRRAFETASSC